MRRLNAAAEAGPHQLLGELGVDGCLAFRLRSGLGELGVEGCLAFRLRCRSGLGLRIVLLLCTKYVIISTIITKQ